MTSLDPDPKVIAMVQGASALPMFLFGLPAGALADIYDRRRLLLVMESAITLLTLAFALLLTRGHATPGFLLSFIFLAGTAAALAAPAWQAIVPQLVERHEDLAPAISLNSTSINISRAIGPALAGLLVTVEYQIAAKDQDAFLATIRHLGRGRKRDGAYRWGILEDTAHEGLWIEAFMVDSWLEHLRQHGRVTNADKLVEDEVQRFQTHGNCCTTCGKGDNSRAIVGTYLTRLI